MVIVILGFGAIFIGFSIAQNLASRGRFRWGLGICAISVLPIAIFGVLPESGGISAVVSWVVITVIIWLRAWMTWDGLTISGLREMCRSILFGEPPYRK